MKKIMISAAIICALNVATISLGAALTRVHAQDDPEPAPKPEPAPSPEARAL